MKSRVIVSAIIEKDDMLLFGKKKENIGPYPDCWHLIGGGVKLEEETLKEAIIREIKEEANIEVEIIKEIGFDEDYEKDKHGEMTHYLFLTYLARYISGEALAKDDIEEIRWIKKEGLSNMNLTRPSIKLFKKIGYII